MPRIVKTRRSKFFQIAQVFRSVPRKIFTLYLGTGLRLVRAIVPEENSGRAFAIAKEGCMESDSKVVARRARVVWGLLIVVVVLLLALAVWKSGTTARTMSAASSDEQEFFRSAVGSTTKFVAEITEVSAEGKIKGRLLRKRTEEVYARTAAAAIVQSNENAQMVMGNPSDVQSGAVMLVIGTLRKDHSVAAERTVILKGYVRVQER
jgi:hypothetical protein